MNDGPSEGGMPCGALAYVAGQVVERAVSHGRLSAKLPFCQPFSFVPARFSCDSNKSSAWRG